MKELEELRKIEDLVFDKRTLLALSKVLGKGIIKRMKGIISMGKEANVYLAETPEGWEVAVKIYKAETAKFQRRKEYLLGDPRFKKVGKLNEFSLAVLYAKKEFKNLELAREHDVLCPTPFYRERNVIVMEFLGEGGRAYPKAVDALESITEEHIEEIIRSLKGLAEAKLVHGDLSMFNILIGDKAYFIDFGQGVLIDHPSAKEYLQKDLQNIEKLLKKAKADVDFERIKKEVIELYGL